MIKIKVGLCASLAVSLCLVLALIAGTPKPAKAQGFWGSSYSSSAKKRKAARRYKKRRRATRRRYRKRDSTPKKPTWVAAKSDKEPIQLVISLPNQKITVYQGEKPIVTSRVSTGKPGYRTPSGIFSILQKNRYHYSNLYNGAPMPFMQRLTWSGVALHAGVVPSYPASHGCIRLPRHFASQLFRYTEKGANVVVVNEKSNAPVEFSHEKLFQPMPPQNDDKDNSADIALTIDEESQINAEGETQDLAETTDNIENRIASTAKSVADDADDVGQKKLSRKEKARIARELRKQKRAKAREKARKRKERLASRPGGAVGTQLAKPKSNSPIRILVTRRTDTEMVKDVQRLLDFLGYKPGPADGYVGKETITAIKRFRYEFMLPKRAAIDDELVARLYRAAGEEEIKSGHLYVRQDQIDIFDAPIHIKNPDKPLGTHFFNSASFDKGADNTKWYALSLKDKVKTRKRNKYRKSRKKKTHSEEFQTQIPDEVITATKALDRIEIPEDIRTKISRMLTPGSSLAITDKGLGPETGKGTDFVVLTQ